MNVSRILAVAGLLLFLPLALFSQVMPQMKSVEPVSAKAGDVLTVSGENLDKAQVDKIYLTDGTNDLVVEITLQEATAVKIKVPAKAKGRLALMLLTKGKEPKLIEQPVKVNIEE